MTKQMVTEKLKGNTDWHDDFRGMRVVEVIKLLQKLPKNAILRFREGYDYVESWVEIEREETDDEYNLRLEQERIHQEQEAERKKVREAKAAAMKRIKELEEEIAKLKEKQ